MTQPLKILILFTQLEPAGIQMRASYMARHIETNGHDVDVLYFYRQHHCDLYFPKATCLFPRKPSPWQVPFQLFPKLYRHLRQGNYDCAISFSHYSNSIGLSAAWLAGIPVRIASQVNPPREKQLSARVFDYLAGLFVYTDNVTVSEQVMRAFSGFPVRYRNKLRLIHNSVTFRPSGLTREAAREMARKKYQIPPDSRLVVTTGRLSPQKNHVSLFPILNRIESLHLVIAGEGPLREHLLARAREQGVADRVHLLGNLSHAELADLYAASDLFFFPSVYEGFGLAPVEAMLSGLPVVASDLPVLCEVIGEGGVLLPAHDTQAWIKAARDILDDPARAASLREAGLERARLYSVEKAYDKFMALISNTLSHRTGRETSPEARS